jgi:hypothetical protein
MHLDRFQKSLIAVPVTFVVSCLTIGSLPANFNVMEVLMMASILTGLAAWVPGILFACSIMRGVDILESLRAGTPPGKHQSR